MLSFIQSLSPAQVATLLGIAGSLLQLGLVKGLIFRLREFEDHHKQIINVVTSGVIPAILTVGTALVSNSGFTHTFPHFAETYLAAQAFYYTVVKFIGLIVKWYQAAHAPAEVTV